MLAITFIRLTFHRGSVSDTVRGYPMALFMPLVLVGNANIAQSVRAAKVVILDVFFYQALYNALWVLRM